MASTKSESRADGPSASNQCQSVECGSRLWSRKSDGCGPLRQSGRRASVIHWDHQPGHSERSAGTPSSSRGASICPRDRSRFPAFVKSSMVSIRTPCVISLRDSFEERLGRDSDVFTDLPKKCWRDVTALVKGNCRLPAVIMPELLVRTTLPHLAESMPLEEPDDLARLEDR